MKIMQAAGIAGLLLLALILPQPALADPGYSITLSRGFGRVDDLIEVTANFTASGTFNIYWNSIAEGNHLAEFTATSGPGSRTVEFRVPETKKGDYKVLLARAGVKEAEAPFEVIPSVTIDPTEGPVGTEVTITCLGFDASEDVRVKFKDEVVKTGRSDAKGSLETSYTIPANPGGTYDFKVEVRVGTLWHHVLSRFFRVTPEITATPDSGTVGQTVEIRGTGFASEEKDIQVTFDGEVRAANIQAGGQGSWSAVITIPPRKSGTYFMDASGRWTRARDVPDIEFIVGAGIMIDPPSAYVGETITVAGGGFRPGETGIRVTLAGTSVATGITAGSDGGWATSFVLPASTHGQNTVSARGDVTAAVTRTLNVKAGIESISPGEGAPGDSVTIIGSGFHGNKKLTVTVGGEAAKEDLQTRANGDVVISFRVPASTPGKQSVVVKDESGATDSIDFTVKEKDLPYPPPVFPEKDSRLRSGVVTFQWQGLPGETGITYTYRLEVRDADTGSVVRSKSVGEALSYTLTRDEALPRGNYHWRVRAIDNYGNESPWSNPSSFTAAPTPTWVWVVVGLVVLVVLMAVAYRETKFKVTE